MAAVITWKVEQMNCYPSAEGETDVVFTVYWRCNGEETTETDTYYGTSYGSTNVEYKEGQPFTPYADLTEDQVLNWVWAAPDFDKDIIVVILPIKDGPGESYFFSRLCRKASINPAAPCCDKVVKLSEK